MKWKNNMNNTKWKNKIKMKYKILKMSTNNWGLLETFQKRFRADGKWMHMQAVLQSRALIMNNRKWKNDG